MKPAAPVMRMCMVVCVVGVRRGSIGDKDEVEKEVEFMSSSLVLRIRIKSEAICSCCSSSRTCTVLDWVCGGYRAQISG